MGNIDFFRKELKQNFKYHLNNEVVPRALTFIKDELNILLDRKINELEKTKNDYTVKPQHAYRKGQDTNPIKRAR